VFRRSEKPTEKFQLNRRISDTDFGYQYTYLCKLQTYNTFVNFGRIKMVRHNDTASQTDSFFVYYRLQDVRKFLKNVDQSGKPENLMQ